jgi:hypothetical protein
LKGIYDGFSDAYRFLITGSGRLDFSQKKGDSLKIIITSAANWLALLN